MTKREHSQLFCQDELGRIIKVVEGDCEDQNKPTVQGDDFSSLRSSWFRKRPKVERLENR